MNKSLHIGTITGSTTITDDNGSGLFLFEVSKNNTNDTVVVEISVSGESLKFTGKLSTEPPLFSHGKKTIMQAGKKAPEVILRYF